MSTERRSPQGSDIVEVVYHAEESASGDIVEVDGMKCTTTSRPMLWLDSPRDVWMTRMAKQRS